MFKLIVAGSRYYRDFPRLCKELDYFLSKRHMESQIEIVSGCCETGADAMGELYAMKRGYEIRRFPANWRRWGKMAGPLRNRCMAEYADALIVFWDGKSKGAKNMIFEAERAGIRVVIRWF